MPKRAATWPPKAGRRRVLCAAPAPGSLPQFPCRVSSLRGRPTRGARERSALARAPSRAFEKPLHVFSCLRAHKRRRGGARGTSVRSDRRGGVRTPMHSPRAREGRGSAPRSARFHVIVCGVLLAGRRGKLLSRHLRGTMRPWWAEELRTCLARRSGAQGPDFQQAKAAQGSGRAGAPGVAKGLAGAGLDCTAGRRSAFGPDCAAAGAAPGRTAGLPRPPRPTAGMPCRSFADAAGKNGDITTFGGHDSWRPRLGTGPGPVAPRAARGWLPDGFPVGLSVALQPPPQRP
jgi:hypothetical protein